MRAELARLEAAANRYMRSKWWARAVETYEELVKLQPHNSAYRVSLAEAYLRMNRKLDAVRIYMSLLDAESSEPTSRLMEYHRAILSIDPSHTESYLSFGDILVKRKLFQDAKSQYLLAVRHYEMSGTFGKAAETMKRIEELDSKNPYIKIHLANIQYKKGDLRDAVESLWRAAALLTKGGSLDDARMVLGEILALDPSHPDAARELEKLGGGRPQPRVPEQEPRRDENGPGGSPSREALLKKADEALHAGAVDRAAGTLERASTLYPREPSVKVRLGEVYERRGMTEDAVQTFWEAISIYMDAGDRKGARELLVRLLSLDPGHTKAQIALAKIEVERSKDKTGSRAAPPRGGAAGAPEGLFKGESGLLESRYSGGQGIFTLDGTSRAKSNSPTGMPGLGDPGCGHAPLSGAIALDGLPAEPGSLESLFGLELSRGPNPDPLFHYQRGLAYLELGLLSEALDELKVAAAIPDKAADALQLMGICYKSKGMLKSALKCFEKGLDAALHSESGGLQLIQNLERLVDETAGELQGSN